MASADHDGGNRQTAFGAKTLAYDDNGNLTQITDGAFVTTLAWDARNRLVSMSGVGLTAAFTYDALGRRASKTINSVATQFQYDGFDVVRDVGLSTTGYLRGLAIDEPWVRGGSEFYLADALGSIVGMTDAVGTFSSTYQYGPFGDPAAQGVPSTNTLQFTGRDNDGTGLQYSRARYYAPGLHRFISEDPIGFSGGDTNFYAYVFNNPTRFRDPLGLTPIEDGSSGPPPLDCSGSGSVAPRCGGGTAGGSGGSQGSGGSGGGAGGRGTSRVAMGGAGDDIIETGDVARREITGPRDRPEWMRPVPPGGGTVHPFEPPAPPPPPIIPPWLEILPFVIPDVPALQRYLDSINNPGKGQM